ncbi:hypothetical protein V6N13_023393 [Hibiscus sabdariffa]|uniref:Uncharacterized protein n=1 Tax=Hibiscus sabdariffa TaxID=183260 RepID=A0ABR2PLN8_9ROSI
MVCEALSFTIPFFSALASRKDVKLGTKSYGLCPSSSRIRCSSSSAEGSVTADKLENGYSLTGTAYDFERATISLTGESSSSPKKVTLVRHGLSSWNEEGRVQGSSNLSVLTEAGVKQAERCREALLNTHFDQCFSSPITRAKTTAEVLWQGREEPLVFLDSLKEAHLFFLEGMKNGLCLKPVYLFVTCLNLEAVDAKVIYPKEHTTWREDPANFYVNVVYPLRKLWATARESWREILLSPGENFLVVTHKSVLRALICTALGLPPEIGEAMLQSLNMTAHMYSDHMYLS